MSKLLEKFWDFVGFLRFGRVVCGQCGEPTTRLWKRGDDVYGIPSDNWAYFCGDCADVIFSDEGFKPHPPKWTDMLEKLVWRGDNES